MDIGVVLQELKRRSKMNSAKAKREIIGLALLLDEVSDNGVFFDYSPHVRQISLRVFESKDCYNEDKPQPAELFKGRFYFDFSHRSDEADYQRIKEFLQAEIAKATLI
jgi:hypothetical protein